MSITWVSVDLSSQFTTIGITTDGSVYDSSSNTGLDSSGPGTGGSTYAGGLVPSTINWQGEVFNIGPVDEVDVVAFEGQAIPLVGITSNVMYFLGFSTNGPSEAGEEFTLYVTYADSATSAIFIGMSDWANPLGFGGETEVLSMPYRNNPGGGHDDNTFWIYGYSIPLDPTRIPSHFTLSDDVAKEPDGPFAYLLAINLAYEDTPGGASASGVGIANASYNIIGSGGSVGNGDFVITATLITTNDGHNLITDSGNFLITDAGGSFLAIDTSFVAHDTFSSGGAIGSGVGIVSIPESETYSEVSDGGAMCYGIGRVGYTPGPMSTLISSCKFINNVKFIVCRDAYIPSITRCNERIIDRRVPKICKVNSKNFVATID